MTRIAVVYDQGTIAAEVAIGFEDIAEVLFLVTDTEYNATMRPLLDVLGQVVPLSGDLAADVRLVRRHRPDAIVTFSEHLLTLTSELAAGLDLPYHDVATVRLLTDKVAQRTRLRDRGVDAVRFATVSSAADVAEALDRVPCPAVLKPRVGSGSSHVHGLADRVSGETVIRQALDATSGAVELMIEEMLVGLPGLPFADMVSVESFVAGDSISHLVTGKQPLVAPFRTCGAFTPSGLLDEQAVEDVTGRALRALGVRTGVTHTEVKLTPEGPRVIEVNGRIGGHVRELYLRAVGIDLIGIAGRLALGAAVPRDLPVADRTYFQYHNLAPISPCRLDDVRHVSRLLSRPGMDQYVPYVQPGSLLPGGVGTQRLDLITGSAPTHRAMSQVLGDALRDLTFVFSFTGRQTEIAAADLPMNAIKELM